ncbi:MAG: exosortase O [Chloroflexi bacterium RBG_16_57_11]|nr:MAG: exosortase O [Chloroflexi bacterium RBG_16_57_11]
MDVSFFAHLYAFLLSFFPPRFRDEFGAEMQDVFTQVMAEAQSDGERAMWVAALREACDLPRLALREHWRERRLPRYAPEGDPAPMEAPVPRWAVWLSLSLFVAPALMLVITRFLTPSLSTMLAALSIAILLISIIAGLAKGLPRWSLPFIGLAIGFVGVYGAGMAMINLSRTIWMPLYQRLANTGELTPRLTWSFITSGMFFLSILLVLAGFMIVLRLFSPTRPFYQRLMQDRTQISFILYGVAPLILLIDFDEYIHEELYSAAILLALATGAWGYLRSKSTSRRILALVAGVTAAFAILGIAKFFLVPLQDWPGLIDQNAIQAESWFESLREFATWFWMVILLLAPVVFRRRPGQLTANLALIGLWLFLFRPIYPYIGTIFTRQEFRLNQFALVGVIGLLIYQARKNGLGLHFRSAPALHSAALMMLVGSSAAFILAERVVDINTLSASLLGLAFYGLLGLWLEPRRWKQGLPAAILLIGTLPFGEHLQTFVGYPVRLLTAALVRDGLGAFGIHTIGIDTILVFESGISQIDLPCSGVKSLWTGGMFLLAATWIEGRKINRRWLSVALIFSFLLFAANLGRVAVLVTTGPVLGWDLLAEMLHVPLGVLGFVGACAALVWMLRRFVPTDSNVQSMEIEASEAEALRPKWLLPALITTILLLAVLYAPRPQVAAAQSPSELQFPAGLSVEPWAFTPDELEWLSADGPLSASRWRFTWDEYGDKPRHGSLLLITSDTWRAHHRPERCFETYGMKVDKSHSTLLSADFPVRVVNLSAAQGRYHYSAVYWLQAPERITDDYATRIWSDLSPQRQTWVLVTILFDSAVDPTHPDLQEFYNGLRLTVAQRLEGGYHP